MEMLGRIWLHIWAATLWVLDLMIVILRSTRMNERTVQATKRTAWPKGLKRELMRRQSNLCTYCGARRLGKSLDIDHMKPGREGRFE